MQFARVLDQDDSIFCFRDLSEQGVDERRLARGRAAGDQDVAAFGDGHAQQACPHWGHDSGARVVVERKHGDRGFPDRESRRAHHWRQEAFEAFAGFRKFGGDARVAAMDFGADMVGHEPHDPFAVGSR